MFPSADAYCLSATVANVRTNTLGLRAHQRQLTLGF